MLVPEPQLDPEIWVLALKNFGRQGSNSGRVTPTIVQKQHYRFFSLVLGVDGWVRGNGSRAVLSLTRHQHAKYCPDEKLLQTWKYFTVTLSTKP